MYFLKLTFMPHKICDGKITSYLVGSHTWSTYEWLSLLLIAIFPHRLLSPKYSPATRSDVLNDVLLVALICNNKTRSASTGFKMHEMFNVIKKSTENCHFGLMKSFNYPSTVDSAINKAKLHPHVYTSDQLCKLPWASNETMIYHRDYQLSWCW